MTIAAIPRCRARHLPLHLAIAQIMATLTAFQFADNPSLHAKVDGSVGGKGPHDVHTEGNVAEAATWLVDLVLALDEAAGDMLPTLVQTKKGLAAVMPVLGIFEVGWPQIVL